MPLPFSFQLAAAARIPPGIGAFFAAQTGTRLSSSQASAVRRRFAMTAVTQPSHDKTELPKASERQSRSERTKERIVGVLLVFVVLALLGLMVWLMIAGGSAPSSEVLDFWLV
jgi:hypothetical protein